MIDKALYENLNIEERIAYLRMIEKEARGLRRALQKKHAVDGADDIASQVQVFETRVESIDSRFADALEAKRKWKLEQEIAETPEEEKGDIKDAG